MLVKVLIHKQQGNIAKCLRSSCWHFPVKRCNYLLENDLNFNILVSEILITSLKVQIKKKTSQNHYEVWLTKQTHFQKKTFKIFIITFLPKSQIFLQVNFYCKLGRSVSLIKGLYNVYHGRTLKLNFFRQQVIVFTAQELLTPKLENSYMWEVKWLADIELSGLWFSSLIL